MRTALIVDDSRLIRTVASQIFKSLGFMTSEAENGLLALEACIVQMPDAILLDWNMPVMDGLTFLGALRERPGGLHPKVIFCTTENDMEQIKRAVHAGADEYIMKPFDLQIMTFKLQEAGLLTP